MDRVLPVLLIVAVVALALAGMALGWRARRRRQQGLGEPATPPAELGAVRHEEELLYVATTLEAQPLERVAAAGLGFRGRARLRIAEAGLVLELAGRAPFFVPRADIRGAGRASWAIDRVVARDGLLVVTWLLGTTPVDSYLRPDDPAGLLGRLQPLLPEPPAGTLPTKKDAA